MMNTKLVRTLNNETCLQHEEQIQELARKTAELEAHASFKEQRIMELIDDNKRIEGKIDNLTDTVNKSILASVQGDGDLKQRVLKLETKSDTQEKLLKEYETKAKKQRDDERARTNQYLSGIGVAIAILSFIFAYVLK